MKKIITILAITSLFSFQAFALTSEACNDPSSTCQAFQLGSEAHVLQDFSVNTIIIPNLGKVRRGEIVNVTYGSVGRRGKSIGRIMVEGEIVTSFTITCYPLLSNINYQGGVSSTLSTCNLLGNFDQGPSLSAQWIHPFYGFSVYNIEFQASVPAEAQDGNASGNIHIEIAYE